MFLLQNGRTRGWNKFCKGGVVMEGKFGSRGRGKVAEKGVGR
jgi:hypothetical protein